MRKQLFCLGVLLVLVMSACGQSTQVADDADASSQVAVQGAREVVDQYFTGVFRQFDGTVTVQSVSDIFKKSETVTGTIVRVEAVEGHYMDYSVDDEVERIIDVPVGDPRAEWTTHAAVVKVEEASSTMSASRGEEIRVGIPGGGVDETVAKAFTQTGKVAIALSAPDQYQGRDPQRWIAGNGLGLGFVKPDGGIDALEAASIFQLGTGSVGTVEQLVK